MYGYQPGRVLRAPGTPLFAEARRALGFFARARGLLGTRSLGTEAALWLDRCASIHMFGMRYAIDVAFLRAGEVVRLYPAVRPLRARACRGADSALEMPLGAIERLHLQPGERLSFEPALGARPCAM
jgi:uncharacterized protein